MRRNNMIRLAMALAAVCAMTACIDKNKQEAQQILKSAQESYDKGNYHQTLSLIVSLRHSHPEAVAERKTALALWQDASEKMAQQDIETVDQLLQQAIGETDSLQMVVDEHKRAGTATAEELSRLTTLRIKRDSLQTRFDALCATVKVVREKRKR